MKKRHHIEVVLSHIFFFFFSAQIFSPYIGDRTIYLELFAAILNPYFWVWCKNKKKDDRIIPILFLLSLPLVFIEFGSFVKGIFIFISVLYLFYTYERHLFYLPIYLTISIIVGAFQFVFLETSPELTYTIGPSSLSKMIWGSYATPTYTNFYVGYSGFNKVSGLSRESGFFASYIVSAAMLLYLQRSQLKKTSRIYIMFLIIGYVISFSKMSFAVIGAYLLDRTKKIANKIPPVFGVIVFVLAMIIIWYHNPFLLDSENETFTHRFGGYATFLDLDANTLIFGNDNIATIPFEEVYASKCISVIDRFDFFAGFAGFMIQHGLIYTVLFVLLLIKSGLSTTGVLMLLLLTLNVQPDTGQNFIILTYFICYKYYNSRSKYVNNKIAFKLNNIKT